MTDETNVVVFEPPRHEPPALRFVELRLDDETAGLEMCVMDTDNNIVATLAFDLVYVTPGFDLDRLRAAWAEWRGSSAAAS